ncbi:MAG: hypothetical protein ACRDZ3_06620 [Acidimicrobiia bacterium]
MSVPEANGLLIGSSSVPMPNGVAGARVNPFLALPGPDAPLRLTSDPTKSLVPFFGLADGVFDNVVNHATTGSEVQDPFANHESITEALESGLSFVVPNLELLQKLAPGLLDQLGVQYLVEGAFYSSPGDPCSAPGPSKFNALAIAAPNALYPSKSDDLVASGETAVGSLGTGSYEAVTGVVKMVPHNGCGRENGKDWAITYDILTDPLDATEAGHRPGRTDPEHPRRRRLLHLRHPAAPAHGCGRGARVPRRRRAGGVGAHPLQAFNLLSGVMPAST